MAGVCGTGTDQLLLLFVVALQVAIFLLCIFDLGEDPRVQRPLDIVPDGVGLQPGAPPEPLVSKELSVSKPQPPAPEPLVSKELSVSKGQPPTPKPLISKDLSVSKPQPPAPNPLISTELTVSRSQPVRYVLYDSHYGQMGNQRFAFVNALLLAEMLNATLVVPISRNSQMRLPGPREMTFRHGQHLVRKEIPHTLLGWYYDYHRSKPPLMFENEFVNTTSFKQLSDMVLPVAPAEYAKTLKLQVKPEAKKDMRERRLCERKRGMCIPEHHCREDEFYRQGSFDTDVLLLGRMFSSYNCTQTSEKWLEINRALRPRPMYMKTADRFLSAIERPVLGIHIRILEDPELAGVLEGHGARNFARMMQQEYKETLATARSVYVANKPGGVGEKVARFLIRFFKKLDKKVYTVRDIVIDAEGRSKSEFPYFYPMLDMTVLSRVDILVGRQRSTFSKAAMYLREANGRAKEDSVFYSGVVFRRRQAGDRRTFACPFYKHKQDRGDPSCRDK